jgi:signal transduction histidine kinase
LTAAWQSYRAEFPAALNTRTVLSGRRAHYREQLLGSFSQIEGLTQKIADINEQNILSADGQVKHQALSGSRVLYTLMFTGIVLILLIILVTATLVLKPIQTLTRSVKEIEKGNLDLVVEVRSQDEMGQLAQAFNAMASRLREFRRTDQARLLRTQQTTQMAINSLPNAVAVLNASGEVEITNQAAVEIFGIKMGTRADTLGLPWLWDMFQKVSREQRPISPKGYQSAVQVFQNGRECFFLPHAIPILDENKRLDGVTLVLVDVTELHRLDEMKSDLLSTVSHELKTSLTSVRMAIHMLLEDKVGDLNPQQTELVLAAREDADRLNHIIEGLLDMGRIQAGRLDMETKPLAAQDLVDHALDEFHALFHEKGVQLSAEIPADIPVVLADPTRVHHILSNLLNNAIRFTSPGGKVLITAEALEKHVLFKVRDTGSGIPKESLPRVFERFFRAPGQSGPAGAGLGLAIVREIVEAHGGEVSVESQEGEGSVFSFTLRRAQTDH